jgi:IclR family acetate operon transcriptional repressor
MDPVPISADSAYAIHPAEHACDILDLLIDGAKGISLEQVAEVTELPKDTTFRYLAVLEARQYVERDEHGRYRPGAAFQSFLSHQRNVPGQQTHPRLE